MSMFGEIKFVVGLQVHQLNHGIFVTQSKYIKEILKTFGLEDSKPINTPMETIHKLSKNDDFAKVNQKMYRPMLWKFQYAIHRKLDIALVVGIVARFSTNPREKSPCGSEEINEVSKRS